ncbi:hypothetical protein EJ08DRAFT_652864 [Tothia fuscella]|uniref:Uncharacterized protein n=1 Tax=Tothia fuscella TaxID=1048955 RepID=A0A9P4NJ37_9PEZI|nr:hypothetical protein EJ08DRAFT_652864 [Tothia fuscella]
MWIDHASEYRLLLQHRMPPPVIPYEDYDEYITSYICNAHPLLINQWLQRRIAWDMQSDRRFNPRSLLYDQPTREQHDSFQRLHSPLRLVVIRNIIANIPSLLESHYSMFFFADLDMRHEIVTDGMFVVYDLGGYVRELQKACWIQDKLTHEKDDGYLHRYLYDGAVRARKHFEEDVAPMLLVQL